MHAQKIPLILLHLLLLSILIFYSNAPIYGIKGQNSTSGNLILTNGNIITMDPDNPSSKHVTVSDGIITGTYQIDPPETQKAGYTLINVEHRAIFPGFIDPHSHWIGDRSQLDLSQDEAVHMALSRGWTSISENFVNQERLDELIQMDNEDRLILRVNAYLPINYQEQRFGDWYKAYTPHSIQSPNVRIGGVKLFMDNGIDFTYDYLSIWFNATELDPIVSEAHNLGYQIYIHTMSDIGTDLALNALYGAQGNNTEGQYRHKLTHAWYLRDDQLPRIHQMKVIVDGQLLWHTSDFNQYIDPALNNHSIEANRLLPWHARWRDVIDEGITFTGSTDMPWIQPTTLDFKGSVIQMIYRAVTRIGEQGLDPYSWQLNQRITVEEALRSMTVDAAYSTFEEHTKGSIEEGKLGDFTVLSDDPTVVDVEDIPNISVDMTIIGGKVVYCRSGLESVCAGELSSSSQSSSRSSSIFAPPVIISLIVIVILKKSIKRIRFSMKYNYT